MIFIGTKFPGNVRVVDDHIFLNVGKFKVEEQIEDTTDGNGQVVKYAKVLSRSDGHYDQYYIIDSENVISSALISVKRLYGDVFFIRVRTGNPGYIYKGGNCVSVTNPDYLILTDGQDFETLYKNSPYPEHAPQKEFKGNDGFER